MTDPSSEPACPPQTILFVEDEPVIRMDMAEFLRDCGYRVHEASNVAEATAELEAKFAIDLVFTDINLGPGPNGLELADWVLNNRPGVKVIVTTGEAADRQAPPGVGPILPKPYTGRDLAARIAEALKRPDS